MSDENPEVTVAKWRAYRHACHRNRKKAHLLSWVLALPVAWFAWETQSYQMVMGWLNHSPSNGGMVRLLAEVTTVGWAWTLTVLFLVPLRAYLLRGRWEVDPERFGLERESE